MKLIVGKNQLSSTVEAFLQRAGYSLMPGHEPSFTRALGRNHHPRFHVYVNLEEEKIIFNMHLDQKEASYEGSHMHNADYEGPVVSGEIIRLRDLVRAQMPTARPVNINAAAQPKNNWLDKLFKR
jgi:hypothetical protein